MAIIQDGTPGLLNTVGLVANNGQPTLDQIVFPGRSSGQTIVVDALMANVDVALPPIGGDGGCGIGYEVTVVAINAAPFTVTVTPNPPQGDTINGAPGPVGIITAFAPTRFQAITVNGWVQG